ncbi:hypothetical protein SMD44_07023 [Streptomyces alboflavus]|uniref:Uncharacterized protein n=1 Tax=Streptomyces alboflavus TaxID=67267 RepID=A0A1Z1WMI9_9ACTN|nr:hypothetical protein SMD44_07023 [Streptomyces alboflavus]
MAVLNVHERALPVEPNAVGALVDALATADDPLWPTADWPPMRLDRGLAPGSRGGHGPVRYTVAAYAPRQWVRFAFTGRAASTGSTSTRCTPSTTAAATRSCATP